MLKRISGKNVAQTTSIILDKLVTWSVGTNYSLAWEESETSVFEVR